MKPSGQPASGGRLLPRRVEFPCGPHRAAHRGRWRGGRVNEGRSSELLCPAGPARARSHATTRPERSRFPNGALRRPRPRTVPSASTVARGGVCRANAARLHVAGNATARRWLLKERRVRRSRRLRGSASGPEIPPGRRGIRSLSEGRNRFRRTSRHAAERRAGFTPGRRPCGRSCRCCWRHRFCLFMLVIPLTHCRCCRCF